MSEAEAWFPTRRRGSVSVIEFNRPSRANAFPKAGWDIFPEVLRRADADDCTNAVVLTGVGRFFCTGGDVNTMSGPEPEPKVRHEGLDLVHALLSMEKPVIAMVNGAAIGLGATIALLCDCIVMSDAAYLSDTHVPLGIVAGDGGVAMATLAVGPHRAKELLLTGHRISGELAASWGLINRCVPASELSASAFELADRLAEQPRFALRATKLAVNVAMRRVAHHLLDVSMAYESISMALPDHQQALQQFRQRSTPSRSVDPSRAGSDGGG